MPTQPNLPTDAQLISLWITRRDETAVSELVQRHRPMVQLVVGRMLRDHDLAQDVVQEVFIALCDQAESIQGPVDAWLRGVAANLAISHLRSHTRRKARERHSGQQHDWKTASDPHGHSVQQLISQCVANLTPAEQHLLVRMFWEGMSQREIAAAAGVSAVTVHKRVRACLERLRWQLSHHGIRIAVPVLIASLCDLAGSPIGTGSWAMAQPGGPAADLMSRHRSLTHAAAIAGAAALILAVGWPSAAEPAAEPAAGTPPAGAAPVSTAPLPPPSPADAAPADRDRADARRPHGTSEPTGIGRLAAVIPAAGPMGRWTAIDRSTLGVLSVDGTHVRRMDELTPEQLWPGPDALVALAVPIPIQAVQGYQIRFTYRMPDAPSASPPSTMVFTVLRSGPPRFDVLSMAFVSGDAPISVFHDLRDSGNGELLVPELHRIHGTSGITVCEWTRSLTGHCRDFYEGQFMLMPRADIRSLEVRNLSAAERQRMSVVLEDVARLQPARPDRQVRTYRPIDEPE